MSASFPELETLKELSRGRFIALLSCLEAGKGTTDFAKDLVIHESLLKTLDLIVGARVLREHGVDKMFKLGNAPPPWVHPTRVYVIPAVTSAARLVCQHVQSLISGSSTPTPYQYHCILVPKALHFIQAIFEEEGVLGHVRLHEYHHDFIPLDNDLLSLEFINFFHSSVVNGDQSFLVSISRALNGLQEIFGSIPNVIALGKLSNTVKSLMEVLSQEIPPERPINTSSSSASLQTRCQFGHLFVFDRDIDFMSLLLSQLTYEGMIDEVFSVRAGCVDISQEESTPETRGERQKITLHSAKDEVYAQIRGRHFATVLSILSMKIKEIQSRSEKRHTTSVTEMKKFVANELRDIQAQQRSIALHINACEVVLKRKTGILEDQLRVEQDLLDGSSTKESLAYIEDCMARHIEPVNTLRLLCLYSLTQDGFSDKEFKTWQRKYTQAYGYEHMWTWHRLQQCSLLKTRTASFSIQASLNLPRSDFLGNIAAKAVTGLPFPIKGTPFKSWSRKLQLVPQNTNPVDFRHPTDLSYVFGGSYVPLFCRLVERFLKNDNLAQVDEALRGFVSGPLLVNQKQDPSQLTSSAIANASRTVLVLCVGGITLAEVAAFRLLGSQIGYHFVIAGTSLINGNQVANF